MRDTRADEDNDADADVEPETVIVVDSRDDTEELTDAARVRDTSDELEYDADEEYDVVRVPDTDGDLEFNDVADRRLEKEPERLGDDDAVDDFEIRGVPETEGLDVELRDLTPEKENDEELDSLVVTLADADMKLERDDD